MQVDWTRVGAVVRTRTMVAPLVVNNNTHVMPDMHRVLLLYDMPVDMHDMCMWQIVINVPAALHVFDRVSLEHTCNSGTIAYARCVADGPAGTTWQFDDFSSWSESLCVRCTRPNVPGMFKICLHGRCAHDSCSYDSCSHDRASLDPPFITCETSKDIRPHDNIPLRSWPGRGVIYRAQISGSKHKQCTYEVWCPLLNRVLHETAARPGAGMLQPVPFSFASVIS